MAIRRKVSDAEKKEKARLAAEKRARDTATKAAQKAEKTRAAAERKRLAAEAKQRAAEAKQRLALETVCSSEFLLEVVGKARTKFNQLPKLSDLKKKVDRALQVPFVEHWGPRIEEGDVPAGLGTLWLASGKTSERRVFLLSDVVPKGALGTATAREADHSSAKGLRAEASRAAEPLKDRLLSEFDRLNERSGGRYYVPLSELRGALPEVTRDDFDAALHALRRDWVLTLSPAEGRHEAVPRQVLDAGIVEQSRLLVYVSRRET